MQTYILAGLLGIFILITFAHGEPSVRDDNDNSSTDDEQVIEDREIVHDKNSIFTSVGQPLARRGLFDLNKFLQRRETSGFTTAQRKFQKQMLNAHNWYRTRHCVSSLRLDDSISQYAQNYAEYLADIDQMVHSYTEGLGENLYWKWSSDVLENLDGGEATDAWYDEIESYNFDSPGFAMSTGHFTQLVWKGSEKLGVGFAITSDGNSIYVVAQYSPQGNYMGQFGQNVLPARC